MNLLKLVDTGGFERVNQHVTHKQVRGSQVMDIRHHVVKFCILILFGSVPEIELQ